MVITLGLVLAGCDETGPVEDNITQECSDPYSNLNGICCLDADYNGVCDAFEEDEPEPECPGNQVKIGMICCLDANKNDICDDSEVEPEPEPKSETSIEPDPEPEPEPECPPGQRRVGIDCCVDANANNVCDDSEPKPEVINYVEVDPKLVIEGEDAKGLQDFPDMFLSYKLGDPGKHFNGLIVIGEAAPARDVLTAGQLSMLFVRLGEDKTIAAYLDNEVDDIKNQNAIIIGRPCENIHSAILLEYTRCNADLNSGEAKIKFFKNGEYVQLVIYGYDAIGTQVAGELLVNYATSGLYGQERKITY